MTDLQPKQFRQGRLFAPLGMTKKPHQQSPLEFADSPRTWWHASDEEDFEDVRRDSGDEAFEEQGFHVGTLGAAHDRMSGRGHSGSRGFFHPVRIDEAGMPNRKEDPSGWSNFGLIGEDKGEDWSEAVKPQFYVNAYEDKGTTSAVLESPFDVMHQADYVHEALSRGGIPSGAAEHFATRLDSVNRHTEGSPGFPRSHFAAEYPDEAGANRRRLNPRKDTHLSPSERVHGTRFEDVGGEQQEMDFPGYQDSHTFMRRQQGKAW